MEKSNFKKLLEKYKKAEFLQDDPDGEADYIEDVNNLSVAPKSDETLLFNMLYEVISEEVEKADIEEISKAASKKIK